jgi:hypothetical protein
MEESVSSMMVVVTLEPLSCQHTAITRHRQGVQQRLERTMLKAVRSLLVEARQRTLG